MGEGLNFSKVRFIKLGMYLRLHYSIALVYRPNKNALLKSTYRLFLYIKKNAP